MTLTSSRTGPLKRVSVSSSNIETLMQAAMLLLEPEDRTQRKVFESLMPYLYVLRNKGCSWPQLTKLLGDCGLNLQPSTVKGYYSEMLATRLDICQERMNEQILLMNEIRKKNQGADISAISQTVSAVIQNRKAAASASVNNYFGINNTKDATPKTAPPALPKAAPAVAYGPSVENSASTPADGNFGLLNLHPAHTKDAFSPGFFNLDDEPAVPFLNSSPPKAAPRKSVPGDFISDNSKPEISKTEIHPAPAEEVKKQYICQPLQEGVPAYKRRDNLPDAVYLPGDLPHPFIPELMLSLEQRLYSAALEYMDCQTGEIKIENSEEKRFRVMWRTPIPMTKSRTGGEFMTLDPSLFNKIN